MSFLNPVNEPVLRFKSTDAGAPQINYNARVAGDVKAVLKACLVTGYGDKASAGWSIANEVGNVAEFVSPSAAMSDYRLGIDDTSASTTTWYYQYQDSRINPTLNQSTKNIQYVDKTHASNGWQLLVTDRGIFLFEYFYHPTAQDLSARITYWGSIKSGLSNTTGSNMSYFCIGHNSPLSYPNAFYDNNGVFYRVGGVTNVKLATAVYNKASIVDAVYGQSFVDIVSPLYAINDSNIFVGEQPGVLAKLPSTLTGLYGVEDTLLDDRPAIKVCAGAATNDLNYTFSRARIFLIYLDSWGY